MLSAKSYLLLLLLLYNGRSQTKTASPVCMQVQVIVETAGGKGQTFTGKYQERWSRCCEAMRCSTAQSFGLLGQSKWIHTHEILPSQKLT